MFLGVDLPILCLIFELLFSRYLLNSADLGTPKKDFQKLYSKDEVIIRFQTSACVRRGAEAEF